jgi:hypothetical protein
MRAACGVPGRYAMYVVAALTVATLVPFALFVWWLPASSRVHNRADTIHIDGTHHQQPYFLLHLKQPHDGVAGVDDDDEFQNVHNNHDDDKRRKLSAEEYRLKDLERIRASVFEELKTISARREAMLNDVINITDTLETFGERVRLAGACVCARFRTHLFTELHLVSVQNNVQQAEIALREALTVNRPDIALPHTPLPLAPVDSFSDTDDSVCTNFNTCFDFSRCSITRPFAVYIYTQPKINLLDLFLNTSMTELHKYVTTDAHAACIFIGAIDSRQQTADTFAHWRAYPSNHVFVVQNASQLDPHIRQKSMLVSANFDAVPFRRMFDVRVPDWTQFGVHVTRDDIWQQLPMLVPFRRQV